MNVIGGEGAQPLSPLKILNSTRDPDKMIGANLNGIPGLVCLGTNFKKILPRPE